VKTTTKSEPEALEEVVDNQTEDQTIHIVDAAIEVVTETTIIDKSKTMIKIPLTIANRVLPKKKPISWMKWPLMSKINSKAW